MTGAATEPPTSEYTRARKGSIAGVRLMLARHGVVAALSLGGSTYLLRDLGPTAWGGFATSYLLLIAADQILTRGVVAALLRGRVAADEATVAAAARLTTYSGVGLASVFLVLAGLLTRWYHPPAMGLLLVSSALCTLAYAARAMSLTLLERDLRYRRIVAAEIGDMVAFYVVAIPLVVAGYGVEALAIATVARGIASLLIFRTAVRAPWWGRYSNLAGRRLLAFGAPLCAAVVVSAFDGLVPPLAIPSAERQVGYIAVAATTLGYATSVVTAVGRVGIPGLGLLTGDDLGRATRHATALVSFLTLTAIVPLAALSSIWVPALLGNSWHGAIQTFRLIAVGLLPAGVLGVLSAALTARGRTRELVGAQALAVCSYVLVGVAAVAVLGPVGIAFGYAASRWVSLGLLARAAYRHVDGALASDAVEPLVVGCCSTAILVAVDTQGGAPTMLVAAGVWAALWTARYRDVVRKVVRAAGRN